MLTRKMKKNWSLSKKEEQSKKQTWIAFGK